MTNPHSYRYRVVDVFTRVPLAGNALAVFPDSRGLDTATMQRIARELNLSETVFVEPATVPQCAWSFRIFTPRFELPYAGHPSIGGSYVLLTEGMVADTALGFSIQEKIGPVSIRVEKSDPVLIWLEAPPVTYKSTFDAKQCAEALHLQADDLLDVPPQLVDGGNPTLLVAVKDKEAVDRASLDSGRFATLNAEVRGRCCLFFFTPTDEGAYSRMFAPEYGVPEDPATGSSTGALAPFMKRHGLLPRGGIGRFVSEQGTKMGRQSFLHFEIAEDRGGDRISVGGYVTPLIEGVMTI